MHKHPVRQVTIPWNAYSSCKLYRLWLTVLMGRNGAGDRTSLLNLGEEYHTSERMVNVMFVYILNCHGQPLMPCQPRKARLLLKEGINNPPKLYAGVIAVGVLAVSADLIFRLIERRVSVPGRGEAIATRPRRNVDGRGRQSRAVVGQPGASR